MPAGSPVSDLKTRIHVALRQPTSAAGRRDTGEAGRQTSLAHDEGRTSQTTPAKARLLFKVSQCYKKMQGGCKAKMMNVFLSCIADFISNIKRVPWRRSERT